MKIKKMVEVEVEISIIKEKYCAPDCQSLSHAGDTNCTLKGLSESLSVQAMDRNWDLWGRTQFCIDKFGLK